MQAQAPGRGGDGGAADPRSLHERPQGGTSEIVSTAAAASSSSNSVRAPPPRSLLPRPPPHKRAAHVRSSHRSVTQSNRRCLVDGDSFGCGWRLTARLMHAGLKFQPGGEPSVWSSTGKPAGRPTELVSALHVVRPAPGFTVAGRSPSPAQLRA